MVMSGKAFLSNNYFPKDSDETKTNLLNKETHSFNLNAQSIDAIHRWSSKLHERQEKNLPNLPKSIPFTLKCDPETMNVDSLSGYGFEVVNEQADGYLLVAADEISINTFIQKIDGFASGQRSTVGIARIHSIIPTESDECRIKRVLSDYLFKNWGIIENELIYLVEVSIECIGREKLPGRKPERGANESIRRFSNRLLKWEKKVGNAYEKWDDLMEERYTEFTHFVKEYDGEVEGIFHETKNSSLSDSFAMQIKISGIGLRDIANNHPFVYEISETEDISVIEDRKQNLAAVEELNITSPDANDAVICVIDSGIQESHLLIEPALISDLSKSYLLDDNKNDKVKDGGHGTRVAGAILYPNGMTGLDKVKLSSWLVNLKVLDDRGFIPEYIYPPILISKIIEEYSGTHGIKLFNQSIASHVPCRISRMSNWAATIDKLSYFNDILLIQAVGNLWGEGSPNNPGIIDHLKMGRLYPDYLLQSASRIANPAQSLSALSVGSISSCELDDDDFTTLGRTNEVSAFSRSGLGIWGTIKPEVVEYGGNYAITKGTASINLVTPEEICIELPRRSPEGPLYSRDCIGTSFSTPKISSIASIVAKEFPNQSSLFYKTLIVQSAKWFGNIMENDPVISLNKFKTIGYGLPQVDTLITNNEFRITAITMQDVLINEGELHMYEVKIPEELRKPGEDFNILVEVTLCYVSNPRRTRKNNRKYLSTWVDWVSSNINEKPEDFKEYAEKEEDVDAIPRSSSAFKWMLGIQKNHGIVNEVSRNSGLTQKDWTSVKSYHLTEGFCIAVRGRKGWDTSGTNPARYSLAVSFESMGLELPIYNILKTEVKVPITLRVV